MSSDALPPHHLERVVTRFAPSPTGNLHIGGARTALFNWLYARSCGGKFLLRIEDTDRERSTPQATEAILAGLKWLGLDWDGEATSQFAQKERHAQVAHEMLARGAAYKCFSTSEEIAAFKAQEEKNGKSYALFRSPWRDVESSDHPNKPYVIRLKAPQSGETVIEDAVQGRVTYRNDQLDDMIVLRSDGTPTYMLAVVVDDHDMGITHVIRGDDHLNNAARQSLVYQAMEWRIPVWAHIPLIHGPDGKKLSKRHGATALIDYQLQGYIASGMRNYLTRLGWAHGDAELFTTKEAIQMFSLEGIGRSPARLDFKKLEATCAWHIAQSDDQNLLSEIEDFLKVSHRAALCEKQRNLLLRGLYALKERSKTFIDLIEKASFCLAKRPIALDESAKSKIDAKAIDILKQLTPQLQNASWEKEVLEVVLNKVAQDNGIGFGKLAAPIRSALSGKSVTPSIYDMMLVIGRDETIARLDDVVRGNWVKE